MKIMISSTLDILSALTAASIVFLKSQLPHGEETTKKERGLTKWLQAKVD